MSRQRFRWLELGGFYCYNPRPGKGNDARRGKTCKILTLPGHGCKPCNVHVVFADGLELIVPWGTLRVHRGEVL